MSDVARAVLTVSTPSTAAVKRSAIPVLSKQFMPWLTIRTACRLELNGQGICAEAVIDRRKTNTHVAADTRYAGMHIPPHVGWTGTPQTIGYRLKG
jgi:hypothetical protein